MTLTRKPSFKRLLFSFQRPAFSSATRWQRIVTLSKPVLTVKCFLLLFSLPPPTLLPPCGEPFRQQGAFITDPRPDCQARFSNKRPTSCEVGLSNKFRRRPTFPHSYPCSIIGAAGLNFCVRDGNRCDPCAIATENRKTGFQLPKTFTMRTSSFPIRLWKVGGEEVLPPCLHAKTFYGQASRSISTGQLNALLHLHTRPINVVVSNGPSGDFSQGDLVLRGASRLDAFSGYPFRT